MNSVTSKLSEQQLLALAEQCNEQGDPWQAVVHCRTLLSVSEDHADALALLGQCLAATGDLPSAGHYLGCAIEIDPNRAQPYLYLGEVSSKIGRSRDALR